MRWRPGSWSRRSLACRRRGDARSGGRGDRGAGRRPRRLRAARRLGSGRRDRPEPDPRRDRSLREPGCRAGPRAAGRARPAGLSLALLTADLAIANSPLVITIPQADFEREPAVLRAIRDAERQHPEPRPVPDPAAAVVGPDRLVRSASPAPPPRAGGLGDRHAPAQLRLVARERVRLRGRERDRACRTSGVSSEPEYRVRGARPVGRAGYRAGPTGPLPSPGSLRPVGRRYFIVPSFPDAWTSENRSYAAFVDQTGLIYPVPASLAGPEHARDREHWLLTRDVQVRRNRRAFPRAWVVHDARLIRPSDEAHPAGATP